MDLSLQLYAVGGVGHRVAQPLKHLIRPKSKERIWDTTTSFICSTCMNRWKGYFVTDTHNNISYQDTFCLSLNSSWTTDNDIIPVAVQQSFVYCCNKWRMWQNLKSQSRDGWRILFPDSQKRVSTRERCGSKIIVYSVVLYMPVFECCPKAWTQLSCNCYVKLKWYICK